MNRSIKQDNRKKTRFASQIADVMDDEAVRIFLEFERVESAIKGRYFLVVLCTNQQFCLVEDQLYVIASLSSFHCITALIMWVKVCPILNGLAKIRNKVRLPAVLHHMWPSNPAVSLRPRQNCAYITAPRKQGRHSKNDMEGRSHEELF